jgi:hypothetical protein
MAKRPSFTNNNNVVSRPKKTKQGRSPRTKLSATSSRPRLKKYRGQGKG